MSHASIRTAFASAILTVGAALGVADSAEAAVYRTRWDPPYGQWFPDLGWSGTSALFIPDSCLVNSGTVACAGMTAGFAQAELFSLSNPSSTETLAFNQIVNLSSATFANGLLTAVTSDFFSPVVATLGAAGGGAYSFSLKFTDQGAFLFHLQNGKETSPPLRRAQFQHQHPVLRLLRYVRTDEVLARCARTGDLRDAARWTWPAGIRGTSQKTAGGLISQSKVPTGF